MLDVHKNYRNYGIRAKKQAIGSASKFSLKRMDKVFDEMMDKYIPKFAQSVDLKLPKLPKLQKKTEPKIKLPKLKKLGDRVNV